MLKKELVKPTLNIVYLEDVPIYCHYLKLELSKHAELNSRLQIHPVIYLEQAYSLLKKGAMQVYRPLITWTVF